MARLAAMSRVKGMIAAAGTAAALGLAGCADSEPEPSIPLESAQVLVGTLQEIQANVDVGSCIAAESSVEELKSEIGELPSDVNDDLRQGLENGADQLGILIRDPDQCERPEEEQTTTEETTTEETTTEETEPTTTEETTTEQTEPTTTPGSPGGTGGLGPGGGGP
jgi:hypothetical protein